MKTIRIRISKDTFDKIEKFRVIELDRNENSLDRNQVIGEAMDLLMKQKGYVYDMTTEALDLFDMNKRGKEKIAKPSYAR